MCGAAFLAEDSILFFFYAPLAKRRLGLLGLLGLVVPSAVPLECPAREREVEQAVPAQVEGSSEGVLYRVRAATAGIVGERGQ